jgi:hypothetical protein
MAHIEKRTRKGRVTYRARYRDPPDGRRLESSTAGWMPSAS